jgi:hypothetical protein
VDRLTVDGCALFYRRAVFTARADHVVEFSHLAMKYGAASEDLLNRVMPKVWCFFIYFFNSGL